MSQKLEQLARDEAFMARALALAERGTGWTSPNPLVGAVIVKDGRIIGEGWHTGHAASPTRSGRRWPHATKTPPEAPCTSHWSRAAIGAKRHPAPTLSWKRALPASSWAPLTRTLWWRAKGARSCARRAR